MTPYEVWIRIAFSAGGVIVGYLLGRRARAAIEHRPSRGHADRLQNLFGVIILIAVVVAGVTWTQQQAEYRRQTECQLEANRAYAAGTSELREAAEIDRQANRIRWGFIREALANPILNPTPEQRREAGARWLRELDEADRLVAEAEAKRRASPSPVPKDCS